MSCQFSLPITISADEVFTKASSAIQNSGGTISGSSSSGTFSLPTPLGKIDGNFSIDAGTMNVIITDKPFFISCSLIEERLAGYVAGA